MKISADFDIREFVPEATWKRHGRKSIRFIDPKVIAIAQHLRDLTNAPVVINNWDNYSLVKYEFSGYRPPTTRIGAKESQHRFGRAIDVKVGGMKTRDVYNLVMAHSSEFLKLGLTTIEDVDFTPTWLHLDCRNIGDKKELLIIKP